MTLPSLGKKKRKKETVTGTGTKTIFVCQRRGERTTPPPPPPPKKREKKEKDGYALSGATAARRNDQKNSSPFQRKSRFEPKKKKEKGGKGVPHPMLYLFDGGEGGGEQKFAQGSGGARKNKKNRGRNGQLGFAAPEAQRGRWYASAST